MIAVVKTGGKQYKVRENEILTIERIPQKEGEIINMEVLLVADDNGAGFKIGAPILTESKVEAKILEHGRGKKVSVIKFKPKVRYKKTVGHRQMNTKVRIEKISA